MRSLSARLLLAISVLLTVFFGATIALLDFAFRESAQAALRERLDVQLVVLIAAAEPDSEGVLTISGDLPEARFLTPGSGLYGQIASPKGRELWRSPSAVGTGLPAAGGLAPGETRFQRTTTLTGEAVFALSLGVEWEFVGGATQRFVVTAAESLAPFHAQVGRFRRQLFGWFGLLTAMLLASQATLMRWALSPMRRIEREIYEIETGVRSQLSDSYPTELRGVTRNMNTLILAERERLARYRNTLGNLAHSLKTPLAVIRSGLEGDKTPTAAGETIQRQVDRMNDIVGYQLQKAAALGGTTFGHAPVPVAPVVDEIIASLAKVHRDKSIAFRGDVDPAARFYGDEGDLMEVLGNLMDNASKWCRSVVDVRVRSKAGGEGQRPGLLLRVEDDGAGIAPGDAKFLLQRGARGDERVSGHGIGLSVVADIVALAGGKVHIARAALGGASVQIEFPPR